MNRFIKILLATLLFIPSLALSATSVPLQKTSTNEYLTYIADHLGIGTTTAAQLITLSANDSATSLTSAGLASLSIINSNTTLNNTADLVFKAADSIGSTVVGTKFATVFTSHTNGAVAADLVFLTRNAGTLGERMRLLSTGFFGVGTTTPWRLLSVGTNNIGAFAISTSTSGCAQFSPFGELYSTGTACGTGGGSSTFGTSSLSALWPIIYTQSSSLAQFSFGGLSTTTNLTQGQLPYVTGVNTFGQVATGTVSSGAGISVTAGQSIIGTGLAITNTGVTSNVGGIGIIVSGSTGAVTINQASYIATSSGETKGQLPYWTSTNGTPATLGGVATGTISGSGPIGVTAGQSVIGTGLTISCASCNTSSASVSSVGTANGIQGGTITTAGTVSLISYLATSTAETKGQLSYWTSTNGNPATLSGTATTTLSGGGPITVSNSPVVLGASGAVLGCATCVLTTRNINTTYPLQGGGSLASDLTLSSAFGTSTTIGVGNNLFLYTNNAGVIVGAASSSFFGYIPLNPTRQITVAGTVKQITSSAGAQDLSADRTWTLSLPSYVQFPGDFIVAQSTTTNATTTGSFYAASSTEDKFFSKNASTTFFGLPSLTSAVLGTDLNGSVIATSTGAVTAGTGITLDSSIRRVIGGSLQITNAGVISVGNGTGVTCSGTNPASCSLAAITANSVLANNTSASAIPTAISTSTLYGAASTGGFVLQWSNTTNGLVLAATSSGGTTFGKSWEVDALGQLAPTTTLAVSVPTWLSINDQTLAYASTTNHVTIFGLLAGGATATTSPTDVQETAVGYGALAVNGTGGLRDNAFGYLALNANIGGDDNVAIGANTLLAALNVSRNIAIGTAALSAFQPGTTQNSSNTAIGYHAGQSFTAGTGNTVLGSSALATVSTGSAINNVVIGNQALGASTIGTSGNVIVGELAGNSVQSDYNTLLGFQSGGGISTGFANTLLGSSFTASNLSTGGGNIGIGSEIFFPSATSNLQLNIGNILFGALPATSTAFQIPISGVIGISTSSPFAKFSIQTNNGDTNQTLFAIGSSTAAATTTLFTISNTGVTTHFVPINTGTVFDISTSTNLFGELFNVSATSSVLGLISTAVQITSPDTGVRIGVGLSSYLGLGGLLDQFVVRGRINTQDWDQDFCDIMSIAPAGGLACGTFGGFSQGLKGSFALTNNPGGYSYSSEKVAVGTTAGSPDAAAFILGGANSNIAFLTAGTSTPVLEVSARINTPQNSTTTIYYIGFDDNAKNTLVSTVPNNGCWFAASSTAMNGVTAGNWAAISSSAGTQTIADTGIASSTSMTTTGGWIRFRVEMSQGICDFYIQNGQTTNLKKVAHLTTNVPTAATYANIWMREASGLANQFDFMRFRVWWRDFLPVL